MRDFLWSQGPYLKGKAKVAWKTICLPKYEGGLGIRKIADMNKALMASHIWSIINKRESLWVNWVYDYKLKGRSFWDVPAQARMTWGWRKLLQLRDSIRPHVRCRIGNGVNTSVWFDNWCLASPLIQHVTPRAISNAGFTLKDKVADLILNGEWKFPVAWYDLYPVLISVPLVQLQEHTDTILWHDYTGHDSPFSSSIIWDTIRLHGEVVPWVKLVWYPQCIPRHAFHLWLVMRQKLKTQDKMKRWDAGSDTNLRLMCCSLCQQGPDSHSHLFFECSYAAKVWNDIKPLAELHQNSNTWDSIITWLAAQPHQKSAQVVIAKLLVAATSYFVWQERNGRLFTNIKRPAAKLVELIKDTVRLKLATMRFKNTDRVQSLLTCWKLPNGLLIEDGDD